MIICFYLVPKLSRYAHITYTICLAQGFSVQGTTLWDNAQLRSGNRVKFSFQLNFFETLKVSISCFSHLAEQSRQSTWMNIRHRLRLIIDVLSENKEFVLGPGITLVPQLFSLPLFISSFVLDCQNLEESSLRPFLIVSYWISFTPQWTSFVLYISPSSFYSNQWRKTDLGRWINTLLGRQVAAPATTLTIFSATRDVVKDRN